MVDLKMPTSLVLSPRWERSYGHRSTSTNGFAPNCIVKIPVKKPLFRLSRFILVLMVVSWGFVGQFSIDVRIM